MNLTEAKHLIKHTSIYGIGNILAQVVSFIMLPLYTAYLTPADYGIMALIEITVDLISIMLGLQISSAVTRYYFEFSDIDKRNTVVSTSYWLAFGVLILFLPLLWFIAPFLSSQIFNDLQYSNLFFVAMLSMTIGMFKEIGFVYLRIRAKSISFFVLNMAMLILVVALNIYFIAYLQIGVVGIFYSSLINVSIFFATLSCWVLKEVGVRFSGKIAKQMISYSFPLIFSQLFRILVNSSDKFFINYFFSPVETGIYSIAQKVGAALNSLVTVPFMMSYQPRRFEIMRREDARQVYSDILTYFFVIICTLGLGLAMLSKEIILLMTSEEFHSAAKYIPLIVLSMIVFSLRYHFDLGILIKKKTKYLAYINGGVGVCNIALNMVLIPHFKVFGGIISIFICYVLASFLRLYFSRKLYDLYFDYLKLCAIITLCVAMYFISVVTPIDQIVISIVYKVILVIISIVFLFLFKILSLDLVSQLIKMVWAKKTTKA